MLGKDTVNGLRLKNVDSGDESVLSVEEVFVAVGQKPNSAFAAKLGVELDPSGAIRVDSLFRTSIPAVYAAGDVCGGTQQIVTAVSAGAEAAMSVFADMNSRGAATWNPARGMIPLAPHLARIYGAGTRIASSYGAPGRGAKAVAEFKNAPGQGALYVKSCMQPKR